MNYQKSFYYFISLLSCIASDRLCASSSIDAKVAKAYAQAWIQHNLEQSTCNDLDIQTKMYKKQHYENRKDIIKARYQEDKAAFRAYFPEYSDSLPSNWKSLLRPFRPKKSSNAIKKASSLSAKQNLEYNERLKKRNQEKRINQLIEAVIADKKLSNSQAYTFVQLNPQAATPKLQAQAQAYLAKKEDNDRQKLRRANLQASYPVSQSSNDTLDSRSVDSMLMDDLSDLESICGLGSKTSSNVTNSTLSDSDLDYDSDYNSVIATSVLTNFTKSDFDFAGYKFKQGDIK